MTKQLQTNVVRVTYFGRCPDCKELVKAGTLRCVQGHWLVWQKKGEVYLASRLEQPVQFPLNGKTHFRDETKLVARTSPDLKSKKVADMRMNQPVIVLEEKNGFYCLQSGGWVPHQNVVLTAKVFEPIEANVIREGGATVWADAKFTERIRLLPKGTRVMIYEFKEEAARVHAEKSEWMNLVTIDRMDAKGGKKK